MRRVLGFLAVMALSLAWLSPAQARLDVRVDIPAQRIHVTTSDGERYNWAISSGRAGFRSPNGVYRPTRLEKNWYSRKYGGAMPYAVFFRGGYAIHGTSALGALGRPASHGCIRLHPANAATFFALVKKHGASATRIALHGAATDNLSQFARAKASERTPAKVATAPAKIQQPSRLAVIDAPYRGPDAVLDVPSRSRIVPIRADREFVVAPARSKAAIAQAQAQARQRAAIAQQRREIEWQRVPTWENAREQYFMRPSLPAEAYGYQPYRRVPGWR